MSDDLVSSLKIDTADFTAPIKAALESLKNLEVVATSSNGAVSGLIFDGPKFSLPAKAAIADLQVLSTSASNAVAQLRELTDEATKAASAVKDSSGSATKSVESADEIAARRKAWRDYGDGVVQAGAGGTSALLSYTGVASKFFSVLAFKMPGLRTLARSLGLVSGAYKVAKRDTDAAARAQLQHAQAAEKAAASTKRSSPAAGKGGSAKGAGSSSDIAAAAVANETFGKSAQQARSQLLSLTTTMSRGAIIGAVAWKVGLEEIAQASAKHLQSDAALRKSISGVGSSLSELGNTGFSMFTTGVKGSLVSLLKYTTGFDSLTDVVDYSAKGITSWADKANSGIKSATSFAKEAGIVFSGWLGSAHAALTLDKEWDAQKYYEGGVALNEMADASAHVQSHLEANASILAVIRKAEEAAGEGRKLSSDKARIALMTTTEALDAEARAVREESQAVSDSEKKSKSYIAYITARTKAIEDQRTALANAVPKKDPADDLIASLQKRRQELELGADAAVVAAEKAKGTSADKIAQIQAEQAAIASLDAAKKAAEKADNLKEQGNNRIEKMKDEIDLLTGAATKAQITMREMSRQGFTQGQIEEVGQLEAELEKLRAAKKDSEKTSSGKAGDNKAAEKGSSEAASLVLRGTGGGSKSAEEKLLNESNNIQKQILIAVKGSSGIGSELIAGTINA